ncbi:conserved hypothetical protein [Sporisorium reilianum SRZ2]|uniref:Diphthine--ammonia ligase n=1 Tax=Sporisorium reilianum (strain SRZ2) TaxID=999809 RepID=E6ZQA6_SPORE|nr:conserved hypothetical protein [Sporisorium reilianum SRZ2]
MKVVGLLSGGKDSCYNLIHCVQQGHELVALATLAPPGSKDELDSYMYQTVGHDAVHLVAEAMQLPLYRRIIKGTAINQRAEYGSRAAASSSSTPEQQDETEDLYHLLMDVKAHHPDIEAVSVGAILSNYQRVRVEHVALRPDVNLVPLTFLWQRSQSELYAEMLEARLVSILIKVAGIGLDERDLGKTLGQMQGKLERLSAMYGAHVCGEGGEYETLTIDSPLFKQRIDVGETETVVHSDSGFGSVSYLRLKNAKLVEKQEELKREEGWARTPPLLDAVGRRTLSAVRSAVGSSSKTDGLSESVDSLQLDDAGIQFPAPSIRRKGRYLVLSNITGVSPTSTTPEDQLRTAFTTIRHLLSTTSPHLTLEHITHINLFLRTQTHFTRINAVYLKLFGVSPPTRACVALPSLPPGCDVVISAVAFDDFASAVPFDRRALHVQARSFWAPANIGPYSQSLVQAEKCWIAGQIGLVPADSTLEREAGVQTALSVQHARRIWRATVNDMGGRGVEKGWVEGGVCWVDDVARVDGARRVWLCQSGGVDDDGDEGENWLGQTNADGNTVPPMLFVVLSKDHLPRSAAVEWQITAHTGRIPPPITTDATSTDDDDDDDNEPGSDTSDVRIHRISTSLASFELVHSITTSASASSTFGILTLRRLASPAEADADAKDAFTASIRSCSEQSYATQLFRSVSTRDGEAMALLKELLASTSEPLLDQTQMVPCSSVHTLADDSTAQQAELALVWHGI